MTLADLKLGDKGYIVKVNGSGAFRKRILEMGFVKGKLVEALVDAPLFDPIKYRILDYEVSLRNSEAHLVEIIPFKDGLDMTEVESLHYLEERDEVIPIHVPYPIEGFTSNADKTKKEKREIRVALVGNPNAGKTSIFNNASGGHEKVGNYGGVTVDSKEGKIKYKNYIIKIVDLPGTYASSAHSPEELFVRSYLFEKKPDIVVNVIGASALERNLFLTTELLDLEVNMIIALNMYDELEKSGNKFDYQSFSEKINIPVIPTVGKTGKGVRDLLDGVVDLYEKIQNKDEALTKKFSLSYGKELNPAIESVLQTIKELNLKLADNIPDRYVAVRLLEGDKEILRQVSLQPGAEELLSKLDDVKSQVEKELKEDTETSFANIRYSFIRKILKQTFVESPNISNISAKIDKIVTSKIVGFPLFFFFMWLMFEVTFTLGSFPQDWMEEGIGSFGEFIRTQMADGPLKDLLVDGIIAGVGAVIVFLPHIMILYLFISFMEDSGYMARAAFIMDKLMRKIGLHGKSFIPLVMGFGCNVPSIMATRTIESRSSRMITILISPFMSCSARLPVFILFAGAFFPEREGLALFGLYMFGILMAILSAILFKKVFFKKKDVPFVMELPPYRLPTIKSVCIHMWEKARQYIQKMGTIILIASIIIWFLSYFPQNQEIMQKYEDLTEEANIELSLNKISAEEHDSIVNALNLESTIVHDENSYLGRIGKTVEPVMQPLGFDWKMSVALVSGFAAKEIIISTLGVLYSGDGEDEELLEARLKTELRPDGSPMYNTIVVISFLLFVLIYVPCIAVIAAIKSESNSWKWGMFSVVYTTGLAWIVSFAFYQIANLIFGG